MKKKVINIFVCFWLYMCLFFASGYESVKYFVVHQKLMRLALSKNKLKYTIYSVKGKVAAFPIEDTFDNSHTNDDSRSCRGCQFTFIFVQFSSNDRSSDSSRSEHFGPHRCSVLGRSKIHYVVKKNTVQINTRIALSLRFIEKRWPIQQSTNLIQQSTVPTLSRQSFV